MGPHISMVLPQETPPGSQGTPPGSHGEQTREKDHFIEKAAPLKVSERSWIISLFSSVLPSQEFIGQDSDWIRHFRFSSGNNLSIAYVMELLVTMVITVVVQSLNPVWLFVTPWTAACQASLSFTVSWSLLKLMSMELLMPANHLILCCPLLLL